MEGEDADGAEELSLSLERLTSYLHPEEIVDVCITTALDFLPVELSSLCNLKKLTAVNGQISLIENLEHCVHLEFLNLSSNMIPRIENLNNNKKLSCLVLDYNPISYIQVNDLRNIENLQQLYLSGTKIDNLWLTVSALKNAIHLKEVAFTKFDGRTSGNLFPLAANPTFQEITTEESDTYENEKHTETMIDIIIRRIGELTTDEIGEKITNLSGSFSNRLSSVGWSGLEKISETAVITEIPQILIHMGERLHREEIVHLGEQLDTLSLPVAVDRLRIIKDEIRSVADSGAHSLTKILSTIQNVLNEDSENFFLDEQDTSSEELDDLFIMEEGEMYENFASPISVKKNYMEFFIHHLPHLRMLDGVWITKEIREKCSRVYRACFEDADQGSTRINTVRFRKDVEQSLMRTYAEPRRRVLSNRAPRQFEYHPTEPGILVYGTIYGDLNVIHSDRQEEILSFPSRSPTSILGLCWLNKDSSKFVAGSYDGTLDLFDSGLEEGRVVRPYSLVAKFPMAESLTSVHANCDDTFMLSSVGTEVNLYDINTQRITSLRGLHEQTINVVKFSHHNPHLFASCSFDKLVKLWDLRDLKNPIFSRKSTEPNVMVCFSPDDRYILSSGVDNEVRQYVTNSGRLHLHLDIKKSYSANNYTRSYYMNSGEYIIVGGCEEDIIRLYSSSTGRFVRDVLLSYDNSNDYYCQSLRSDPFSPFTISALVARKTSSNLELTEISLLQNPSSS